MLKMYSANILLFIAYVFYASSQPLPLDINLSDDAIKNIVFKFRLPNNDTVEVDLPLRLLTYTNNNNKSSSTPTLQPLDFTIEKPKKKFVSVEEAIEGFRQELIKNQLDIAGYIDSKDIFYRHFRLEFDDNTTITIRCTYDSNYANRSLQISCYEYHEYETERILSNAEVEMITQVDTDYKSDIELVDLRNMKQTYKMSIT